VTVNDGNGGANYSVHYVDRPVGSITPRMLSLDGAKAVTRSYDGTVSATLDGSSLAGVIAGDEVAWSGSGTFSDKNVGSGKAVSFTNIGLSGLDARNYALNATSTSGTGSITPAALALTSASFTKVYDGTTALSVASGGSFALQGVIGTEQVGVSLAGNVSARFEDKNAGTDKAVIVQGTPQLTGADAGNYTLANASGTGFTARGTITPAPLLTVIGAIGVDRVYDGSVNGTATTTGVTIGGVLAGDSVTGASSAKGTFADKNVGFFKTLTLTEATLTGPDAGNYALKPGSSIAYATVTPKQLAMEPWGADGPRFYVFSPISLLESWIKIYPNDYVLQLRSKYYDGSSLGQLTLSASLKEALILLFPSKYSYYQQVVGILPGDNISYDGSRIGGRFSDAGGNVATSSAPGTYGYVALTVGLGGADSGNYIAPVFRVLPTYQAPGANTIYAVTLPTPPVAPVQALNASLGKAQTVQTQAGTQTQTTINYTPPASGAFSVAVGAFNWVSGPDGAALPSGVRYDIFTGRVIVDAGVVLKEPLVVEMVDAKGSRKRYELVPG